MARPVSYHDALWSQVQSVMGVENRNQLLMLFGIGLTARNPTFWSCKWSTLDTAQRGLGEEAFRTMTDMLPRKEDSAIELQLSHAPERIHIMRALPVGRLTIEGEPHLRALEIDESARDWELEQLVICDTAVGTIHLPMMPSLGHIEVTAGHLKCIGFAAHLPSLESLNVCGNNVAHLFRFGPTDGPFRSLKRVDLRRNPLADDPSNEGTLQRWSKRMNLDVVWKSK